MFDTPADTDNWVSRFMKTAAAFRTTKYNLIDVLKSVLVYVYF